MDFAVAKAKEAFDDGRWRLLAPGERKAVLLKLAKLMEENRHELAVLESLDSGKPIRECQTVDVPDTIHTIRWHAELIDKIYDSTAPVATSALALVVREPIGVVGLVLPWNFPLLMLAWKIGPALASGCSVIVKPAEQTSLTTLRVAELAIEAGVPAGVFNVVTGTGKDAGEPLGLHNDVAMVSFTGSTATGRRFLRYAADFEPEARRAGVRRQEPGRGARGRRGPRPRRRAGGERRLLEHGRELLGHLAADRPGLGQGRADAAHRRLHARVEDGRSARPGEPGRRARQHGALREGEVLPRRGRQGRARRRHRGRHLRRADGRSTASTPDSRLFQEEVFGPVLAVTTFETVAQAVALANDTPYGLAASVYTGSLRNAIRLSREIRAGVVTVNCFGEGDVTTPFGGYKESGFGGRDKSIFAHDQYTELKTIWIDVSDRPDETVR